MFMMEISPDYFRLKNFILVWLAFTTFVVNIPMIVEGCGPTGPAPARETKGYPDCNFTSGLCDWKNGKGDKLVPWITINETFVNNSGPSVPQRGAETGYATLDHKDSKYGRDKVANLESPKIKDPVCMKFFFHLHGHEAGILEIKTYEITTKRTKTIFYRFGDHGSSWQRGQLFINITGEYQVTITGIVGNSTIYGAPAVDDIQFSNDSCVQLPEEDFNCTMGRSRCAWTDKGSLAMLAEFDTELKRYVVRGRGTGKTNFDKINFKSPHIDFSKACFYFSYRARRASVITSYMGRLFLFVVTSNKQEFPVWSEVIYYGTVWTDVQVDIELPFGQYQVIVEGLGINGLFYFRDFTLYPNNGSCKSRVEKTFYLTSPPSRPQNISLSDKSGFCDSYPKWYLKARTVPSREFPLLMFVYSKYNSLVFNATRNDELFGDLLHYFYVSKTNQNSSQAVHFSRQSHDFYSYVTSFGSEYMGRANNNSFFVKEFGHVKGDEKCDYGWTEISGKCYKLFCEKKLWSLARLECFRNEADLASFGTTELLSAMEYLERVQVRLARIKTISVGLERIGQNWIWLDGRRYDGNILSEIPRGRLAWNEFVSKWAVEAAEIFTYMPEEESSDAYFCQKLRVNTAYSKTANQSSTVSDFTASLAVDGDLQTCSLTSKRSQPFWWQVNFGYDINLFRIKITPSANQKKIESLNISITGFQGTLKITNQKTIHISKQPVEVFYDPPVISRFVKLQTFRTLHLCEVETYGADDLNELRGVSWTLGKKLSSFVSLDLREGSQYPEFAGFFGIIPSFDRPTYVEGAYTETMEAYFMAPVSGNYSFVSTGDSSVELSVSSSRTSISSPALEWKFGSSQVQYFARCTFHFLRVSVKKVGRDKSFSLRTRLQNTSFEKPISPNNLFWILPGKLEVNFSFGDDELQETIVNASLTLTGIFSSRCLGFYCGYCSLAVFLEFAGQFECVLLGNQTAAKNGSLKLYMKDWVVIPGPHHVVMGYQIDGNCSEIVKKVGSDFGSNTETNVISRLTVKPEVLISCAFLERSICNKDVTSEGWHRVKVSDDNPDFGFQSWYNGSSSFSLGWIKKSAITIVTGICVNFRFRMANSMNKNLSLSVRTSSGLTKHVWSLSGNHGENWNSAWISLALEENLMFTFEVNSAYGNQSVSIANVRVTTEKCSTTVHPDYAKPGHVCPDDQFRCHNGECLQSSRRCDGDEDCKDGSDEDGCDCLNDEFRCEESKKCILASRMCDNTDDCGDGSDERICDLCKSEEFYCPSGKCVLWSTTCNGKWDCYDGSDEPDVCKKSSYGISVNKTCSLNDLGCLQTLESGNGCEYFRGNCDFENGFCGWYNTRSNYSFEWQINQGATPSENTGPEVDHTTTSSTGSYIYIEASSPPLPGYKARLVGGTFQGDQIVCFKFYYHMFGNDIGQLSIYIGFNQTTEETLLWRKSGARDERWHEALVTVESKQDYRIIIEGVRGKGHLGDIAIDDITVTNGSCTSQNRDETIAVCSFDEACLWSGVETWERDVHTSIPPSFLQGSFNFTETPFSLSRTVNKSTTIRYQCLSLWHRHTSTCHDTSIYFAQLTGKDAWNMSIIDTNDGIEDWRFTEIPLRESAEEYQVSINAIVRSNSKENCVVSADEIQLSPEPCMIIQESKPVLARVGSKFYHGLQTTNSDKSVEVFFRNSSPKVYGVYSKDNINQIVEDIPANLSKIELGARVVVAIDTEFAVSATVVEECSNISEIHGRSYHLCNMTVLLDSTGENVTVSTQKVWLLPIQLDNPGPMWRLPLKDCRAENSWENFCYEILEEANWYDAIDSCKQLGGNISSVESPGEERFIANTFPNISFWVGNHYGYPGVMYSSSNHSNDSYDKIERKGRLSHGVCTVLHKGNVTERPCSNTSNILCKVPGKRRVIFCKDTENSSIQCQIQGTVLNIRSAIIGQDAGQLEDCFNYDVSAHQKPCTKFPDQTAKTKIRCDGKTTCNLHGAFKVQACSTHDRYYDVTYTCHVNDSVHKEREQKHPWCPDGYISFKSSCYKFVHNDKDWQNAKRFCELDSGSKLVTVNDEEEENFLIVMMKSLKAQKFWIGLNDLEYEGVFEWLEEDNVEYKNWISPGSNGDGVDCAVASDRGWLPEKCDSESKFVCEYRPSEGSCDFELGWCGWKRNNSDQENFSWTREDTKRNQSADVQSTTSLHLSPLEIFRWNDGNLTDTVMLLSTDAGRKLPIFTLCLWIFPSGNTSDSALFSYEGEGNLLIHFTNGGYFKISMQQTSITTKAALSFGEWQHICFSLNTWTSLWRFFKNGLLFGTGIITDHVRDRGQIVIGGQLQCGDHSSCRTHRQYVGKMTKFNMWSRMLDLHEVSMLSMGCGMTGSGDVVLSFLRLENVSRATTFDQECRNGQGWRLSLSKHNISSQSSSSVSSPWMTALPISAHGVCLDFAYRLFGNQTELRIALERKTMEKEVLWKSESSQNDAEWKHGRVTLGILSQFMVQFTGKLKENGSRIYIDNVLFKTGMCEPLPTGSQEWDTYLSSNSTGFLTSPYYPSFYLNNMKRRWQLRAPDGQRIEINILYINLEDDPQCTRDYVAFQDVWSSEKTTFYCGKTIPATFTSQTNIVWVIFRTDSSNMRKGFKLRYEVTQGIDGENTCYFTDVQDCPTNCHCHRWPSNQTKISVTAKKLGRIPSRFPKHTCALFFDNIHLSKLTDADFTNLKELEYLSLTECLITTIEGAAFHDLHALKTVRLSENLMTKIPRNLFRENPSLEVLDLGGNRIKQLENRQFLSLTRLQSLSIRLNRLTNLDNLAFTGLQELKYLYLDGNELSVIEDDVFKDVNASEVLFLQQNKLNTIKRKWFKGMTSLRILHLSRNQIESVEIGCFDDLRNLVELDLSRNRIEEIPENLFSPLVSLKRLKVDHFTLCCYAEKSIAGVSCTSLEGGGVSSCSELLKNEVLQYAIWVLGVMAFLGNLAVLLWRLFKTDKNKVNSFLLTNLAISDLLMGVYMLIIAYKNTVWQGVYFKHDVSWRHSDLCVFAGIVSTVSSEVSVLTLSVITFDRLICLVFPFRFRRMSMKRAATVMAVVWLIGVAIAVVPLLHDDYFYDYEKNAHFYGRSAVCLPFQLSSERTPGWEYSVSVFLVLNGVSFLFIVAAYVVMYRTITRASSAVRSTRMNQDSTLAKRMMFIILTDFFCWFPVIGISILALTGTFQDPHKEVYAWIAVFVLPINSSINPLLYTFSTPLGKKGVSSKSTHSKSASEATKSRKTCNEAISSKSSTIAMKSNQASRSTNKSVPSKPVKPSVIHRHEMLNEAFRDDEENPANSYSIDPTAEKTFVLKPVELSEASNPESNVKTSFLAFYEVDRALSLCLVQVYDQTCETAWENTKTLVSTIASDEEENGPMNFIPFLWSATAREVSIKNDSKEDFKVQLEPEDLLICYGYPSKETLEDFLRQSERNLTAEVVCLIASDLIRAISHLTSKKIVHNAVHARNIIVSRNLKWSPVKAFLGGFSSAQFAKSPPDDGRGEEFDDLERLKKPSSDLKSYGNILQIILENCSESADLPQLTEIINSCLSEDIDVQPEPRDILMEIEAIHIYQNTTL